MTGKQEHGIERQAEKNNPTTYAVSGFKSSIIFHEFL